MKLKGKTLKGKNRIRELGEDWDLVTTANSVLFDARPGPWLAVAPRSKPNEWRWIHSRHDDNFEIVD
jgi:hypothetical protein